jgi:hypothetical protein
VRYLLTLRGFAQKTRLPYEYMRFSLDLYAQTRRTLRDVLEPLVAMDHKRFAVYGTGEAAELAYLTLKEVGLKPVAVYAENGPARFLGLPVLPKEALSEAAVNRIIVASFDGHAERQRADLRKLVPDEKLVVLGQRRGV